MAMASGELMYPAVTVQAYASLPKGSGCLLGAAYVKSHRLYSYAADRVGNCGEGRHNQCEGVWKQVNPADGKHFICVDWTAVGATELLRQEVLL
jgi:hypothetical protein